MRAGWPMVPPFDGGPFLAVLGRASFRPRISRDAFEREKWASPARERVTEIVYISFDLYHRAISPAAPPLPPSLSLPLSHHALFFFPLFSLLISPGSLSGLSLSLSAIGIALARRLSVDAQLASSLGDARGPYSRCLDFDISAIYCGAT